MVTQYHTATTLDGYIADTNNSLGWLFDVEGAAEADAGFTEFFGQVGAMCMGATTYEWVMANQPPETWHTMYGDLPCWVFTHRDLPTMLGANLRFVSGTVEPVHAEMATAAGDRNIWIVGGGELAGQFADAGLLDEVDVSVAPVTLGAGAPLLPRRISAARMHLAGVTQSGQFAELRYRLTRPAAEE
ncbi:dihydrofolate reductase family protein [Nocardia sp. CNY236]|uniref:dihydrofolate reductase family protein n=1 Tax=Nocardia sp. CNY236 TaxID=1169152 RepID=UPI000403D504|nr:dihydrofolate reductase family protein [Nocardia sp. CNY236]